MRFSLRLFPLLALLLGVVAGAHAADDFESIVGGLADKSLKKRAATIERLATVDDERIEPLFQALLDGRVYRVKKDNSLVYGDSADGGIAIVALVDGAELGTVKKRRLRKVAVNNKLRRLMRTTLATRTLGHPDPARRIAAIDGLLKRLDDDAIAALRERATAETDERVLGTLEVALAVADARTGDAEAKSSAIAVLGASTQPLAGSALQSLVDNDELDDALRTAAAGALGEFEARRSRYESLETLFFGLSLGSVLALAAVGLAITFGVIGVINMAHGELIMLGAYTTYVIQQLFPNALEWSLLMAIPAAFLVAGAFGLLIERGVIRLLYGRPLETLLATFGISLLLQQMVRSIFSPLNRSVATPDWMSGSWQLNAMFSLTYNRLVIILFTLAVFIVLAIIMKRTSLGLQVRAVAQNRSMASAMGVRSGRVDALTFALGSGIAGVAGVALSQLTNVGPNLGQGYIVDSFMVVVFGGVGNLWGTLVSGLTLGVANKLMEPWTGAVLAKVLVLVFIILFIQRRPRGLFPQKGRAADG